MTGRLVVLCSVGQGQEAERIASELVARRLAACVNVLPPCRSIYRWKGELERAEESLLVIKTTAERFEAVRQAVVALHSYEVPEVIALEVAAGHAPYLAWLDEAVAD